MRTNLNPICSTLFIYFFQILTSVQQELTTAAMTPCALIPRDHSIALVKRDTLLTEAVVQVKFCVFDQCHLIHYQWFLYLAFISESLSLTFFFFFFVFLFWFCFVLFCFFVVVVVVVFSDINECASGTHNCSVDAECINTNGSHICECKPGHTGNGRNCTGEIWRLTLILVIKFYLVNKYFLL